jgi:hypothetical protein
MSRQNEEVVRRACELFFAGPEAASEIADLYDPEIEVNDLPGALDAESRHGYSGLVEFAVEPRRVWSSVEYELSQFVHASESSVLVRLDLAVTGRGSGIRLPLVLYALFRFREGRIVRQTHFATRAEALEAAGLST